jgi:hypothetical protein
VTEKKRTPMRRPVTSQTAQVTIHRSLEEKSKEVGSDSLTEEFKPEGEAAMHPDAFTSEATGNIGMTLPTDRRFEMLRIDVGGRLPCTSEAFCSGKAHDELFDILRKKFKQQHERGKDGL